MEQFVISDDKLREAARAVMAKGIGINSVGYQAEHHLEAGRAALEVLVPEILRERDEQWEEALKPEQSLTGCVHLIERARNRLTSFTAPQTLQERLEAIFNKYGLTPSMATNYTGRDAIAEILAVVDESRKGKHDGK